MYLLQMVKADSDQHSNKTHQTTQESLLRNEKKICSQHNPNSQNINASAIYRVLWGKGETEGSGTEDRS